jgi:hypothetical protein
VCGPITCWNMDLFVDFFHSELRGLHIYTQQALAGMRSFLKSPRSWRHSLTVSEASTNGSDTTHQLPTVSATTHQLPTVQPPTANRPTANRQPLTTNNLTAAATLVLLRSVDGHTAAWLRVLLWAHFQQCTPGTLSMVRWKAPEMLSPGVGARVMHGAVRCRCMCSLDASAVL